ncbi:MAG: TrkH family potassium uptake protein [Roseobacter sp.]
MAELPLFLLIFGAFAASMIVPALHGGASRNLEAARAFLYCAILGVIIFGMVAMTISGQKRRRGPLTGLLSLFSTMVFLPVALAIPFHEGLGTTTFLNAYVEMVSAITTTGATIFDDPERLNGTLHLWRAQVAWLGGLIMWIAASAILAPLALGGFEVTAQNEPGQREVSGYLDQGIDPRAQLFRILLDLAPIYLGLTVLLWVVLIVSGDAALVGLIHAMSIMSTSGISPQGGLSSDGSGFTGEFLMVLFMLFALSRLTFSSDTVTATKGGLRTDPEFRIGFLIVMGVPLVLFLRHWIGALDVAAEDDLEQALPALWGAFFTVMSFLTTTGFLSAEWDTAQTWSGLETPGIILIGLALIGGGVATTAGGVKLLRVYALYLNGARELEKLVHPSSVSRAGGDARRVQSNGAFIAWIFFMLFALSLAALTVIIALLGSDFDEALVLSVAGLSTTGPLLEVGTDAPIRLAELQTGAKAAFCAAMVLGRLETLAIIALLTPDLWRG